jgi:hypothetical protein
MSVVLGLLLLLELLLLRGAEDELLSRRSSVILAQNSDMSQQTISAIRKLNPMLGIKSRRSASTVPTGNNILAAGRKGTMRIVRATIRDGRSDWRVWRRNNRRTM